jgi:apolipoprotein D and lipocalin family protein
MKKVFSVLQILSILGAMAAVPSAAHAFGRGPSQPELTTVPYVDLNRYLGRWYEISSIPQSFQKGCTATRATYTANPDGTIGVLNECNLDSIDGKLKQGKGKARVVDSTTNAKLKVTFFWPFSGDYWIVDLGPNYEYAAVGAPNRDYLWILSRNTTMDELTYNEILERMTAKGFDVSRLVKQVQP